MPTFKNTVTGATEIAIVGTSTHHHGVAGESKEKGAGVLGVSSEGEGVSGFSKKGHGVVGQSDQASGVRGLSKPGRAVEGLSETGDAVVGSTDSGIGVSGTSSTGHGVNGQSESGSGVRGTSKSGRGVEGWSESAYGVSGDSAKSAGVRGTSVDGRGVEGWTTRSEGVFGISVTGTGVSGVAGRSPFVGKLGVDDATSVFRVGASAKQWAEAAGIEPKPEPPAHEEHEQRQAVRLEGVHVATERGHDHAPEGPVDAAMRITDGIASAVVEGLHGVDVFDDAAGIGVCGEHRGAGIGVKAVSRGGMGLAAYSNEHEGVHAETHSMNTAAVAAYNLNPRGGGAAVYARKLGPRGHAGFFDGRVWVGGELAVGGDILLANADCAEDFDVVNASTATAGTVMVIGDDGVLEPSSRAYDRCVVGVISGAGDYKPGLILDKQASSENRQPIALLGKVCCKVTAEFGAIDAGDLLTTSPVPGHAMKSSEPSKAFGAVIGKALRPLRDGRGLIPILIALQ
jgi:hypothetical protein